MEINQYFTKQNENGVSLLETLIVLSIVAIILSIGLAIDYRPFQNPLITETSNLESFLKHNRSKAVSSTSAIMILPESFSSLKTIRGISCGSINPDDTTFKKYNLASEVFLGNLDWSTCFTSRGLASENIIIPLNHNGKTKNIEIMIGGGTRVL